MNVTTKHTLGRTLTGINLHVVCSAERRAGVAQHVRLQRWLAQTLEFVVPLSGQPAGGFQMGLRHNLREALHTMYQVYE